MYILDFENPIRKLPQDWAELLLFSAFTFSRFSTAVLVSSENKDTAVAQACFHFYHFVLELVCTLHFLHCNLDFVLFFDPLLNLFTLCQIMLSNI